MIEGDLSRLMAELRESAESLHKESESLQDVVEEIEAQLAALNMDLEIWLEDSPLSIQELSVSASNVAPHLEIQLGFAPVRKGSRDKWRLQLREAEYAPQMHVSEEPDRKLMRVTKTQLLTEAVREDLIAGVSKLPELLREYNRATRERIDVIQGARRLVEDRP